MRKFIVMGSWCEYMADLHTLANNEEEARAAWEKAFTEDQKAGLTVKVYSVEGRLDEFWMGDGYTSYFGGYY